MKNQLYSFIILFLFITVNSFSQSDPIDVSEFTLKVDAVSIEEFYFGFAEGDKIIFNFFKVNNERSGSNGVEIFNQII